MSLSLFVLWMEQLCARDLDSVWLLDCAGVEVHHESLRCPN